MRAAARTPVEALHAAPAQPERRLRLGLVVRSVARRHEVRGHWDVLAHGRLADDVPVPGAPELALAVELHEDFVQVRRLLDVPDPLRAEHRQVDPRQHGGRRRADRPPVPAVRVGGVGAEEVPHLAEQVVEQGLRDRAGDDDPPVLLQVGQVDYPWPIGSGTTGGEVGWGVRRAAGSAGAEVAPDAPDPCAGLAAWAHCLVVLRGQSTAHKASQSLHTAPGMAPKGVFQHYQHVCHVRCGMRRDED